MFLTCTLFHVLHTSGEWDPKNDKISNNQAVSELSVYVWRMCEVGKAKEINFFKVVECVQ